MSPSFADMRTIQGAIESSDSGFNPQIDNPGDPWARTMNYPKVWLYVARFLNLQTEINFLFWNTGVILLFTGLCAYILWKSSSFGALLVLLSNSSLLALERGNNDLVIILLLAASVFLGGIYRYLCLIVSMMLKIYPVLTLPFLRIKTREKLALTTLMGIYIFIIRDELPHIFSGNSAGGPLSYGIRSTSVLVRDYTLSFFGASIPVGIFVLLMVLTILVFLVVINKSSLALKNSGSEHQEELFITGASIYCMTFVLAANWDYRLIFLILCLPLLSQQPKKIAFIAHGLILLSSNYLVLDLIFPNIVAVVISVLAKSLLFSFLILECWKFLAHNRKQNLNTDSIS